MPTEPVTPELGDAGLLTCEPCMRHVNDDRERLEALADAVGVDLDEELPGYLRTYHDAGHRDPSGPAPEEEPVR